MYEVWESGACAQKCWGNLEKPDSGTKSEEKETGRVRSEVVSVKKESSNRPGVWCFRALLALNTR